MATTTYEIDLEPVVCSECGMMFAFPVTVVRARRRDHTVFYCPMGHSQYFPGESDVEKLKRELKATKQHATEMREWGEAEATRRRATERSLSATRGVLTRTKNRIAHGVCPCCSRTFSNLERHMSNQHPDYLLDPPTDAT